MPSQLMPFNEEQFDRCALWLVKHLGKPPTQYDLIKFHVMTDVYHVLCCGSQIIGGPLEKWKWGPVVPRAFRRLKHETERFERGQKIGPLEVHAGPGNIYEFTALDGAAVDDDEFSNTELSAMEEALKVVELPFDQSQQFFHEPNASFMGKAWFEVSDGSPIDWNNVVDAYDIQHRSDHGHIKALIAIGA